MRKKEDRSPSFGINKSVVRGRPLPNYSNAIKEHQHEYLY